MFLEEIEIAHGPPHITFLSSWGHLRCSITLSPASPELQLTTWNLATEGVGVGLCPFLEAAISVSLERNLGAWAEVRTTMGRAGGQLTEDCPGKLVLSTEAEHWVLGHLRWSSSLVSQGHSRLMFLAFRTHEEARLGPHHPHPH